MIADIVKLKVRETTSTGDPASLIESKFIETCTKLDVSIFEPLINEEEYFDGRDKWRFLQSLKDEFDRAREEGAIKTTLILGTCKGCNLGHETYQFYGKRLVPVFSYIMERNNGRIENVFRCNKSSGAKVVDMRILKVYDFWRSAL